MCLEGTSHSHTHHLQVLQITNDLKCPQPDRAQEQGFKILRRHTGSFVPTENNQNMNRKSVEQTTSYSNQMEKTSTHLSLLAKKKKEKEINVPKPKRKPNETRGCKVPVPIINNVLSHKNIVAFQKCINWPPKQRNCC